MDWAWLREQLEKAPEKKTLVAREQERPAVKAKREAFVDGQHALDASKLLFVDESGFRLGSPPNYGWAPTGKKSHGQATHGRWETMTMIGAISLDGWRGHDRRTDRWRNSFRICVPATKS